MSVNLDFKKVFESRYYRSPFPQPNWLTLSPWLFVRMWFFVAPVSTFRKFRKILFFLPKFFLTIFLHFLQKKFRRPDGAKSGETTKNVIWWSNETTVGACITTVLVKKFEFHFSHSLFQIFKQKCSQARWSQIWRDDKECYLIIKWGHCWSMYYHGFGQKIFNHFGDIEEKVIFPVQLGG